MKSHHGDKGLHYRLSMLFPLLALAIMLAGCGGGTLATEAGTALDNSTYAGSQPADNLASGNSGGQLLPLGSALPALPADSGPAVDSGSRSTSAVQEYNGSDFLIAAGGTVEGTSLLLQSSEDDAAWGLYKASGLAGKRVLSFALETRPEDLETTYYVALGSFNDNRWHWLIETTLPEVNISFNDNEQQWISQLGNLYWVVLVDGGKSLYVDKASITFGDGNGGGGPPNGECIALGPIESLDDLAIIVDNHYFIHNNATYWLDEDGVLVGPDAFAVGDMVLVHGFMPEDPVVGGGCVAISVEAVGGNGGEVVRFSGPIDAIDEGNLTVGGMFMYHDADTQWIGPGGQMLGWQDFAVGDQVSGAAIPDTIGFYAALVSLDNGGGGGGGQRFMIDGAVAGVTEQYFLVDQFAGIAPQMLLHNADTVFVNADGSPAGWQDMHIGDFVHAEGDILPDGAWLAQFVVINPDNGGGGGGGQGFVLDGLVSAIGPDTISVDGGPAGIPQTVAHDNHTLFLLPDGMEGSWQDVNLGDFVHIDGQITPDGAWLADVIMDFGDNGGGGGGGGGNSFTLDGYVAGIWSQTISVSYFDGPEYSILHDQHTQFILPDGQIGSWEDVNIGDFVHIDGQITPDGAMIADVVIDFGEYGGPKGG